MPTRETCNMSFSTSAGKKHTVRIQNPDANLSPTTAINAATMFMSANPFDETVGSLSDLLGIEIVTTTRTVLV